jgi:hypothetical protein
MSVNLCEACQRPETACDCLGPRSLACDSCGRHFKAEESFYESRAFRLLEGGPEDCGESSVMLTCERCEDIRCSVLRWLRWIPFLFGGKS